MPYIDKYKRAEADMIVDEMIRREIFPNGMLNYMLFRYCKNLKSYRQNPSLSVN